MPDSAKPLTAIVSPPSPFARKVRVTILECGLTDQVGLQHASNTALKPDPMLIAANPLGKLPALLRPDGPVICDSRVITRYLADLSGTDLYPQDRIWDVLTLEAMADGVMEAALTMAYEHRFRPPEMIFHDWVEAQWRKVIRTLVRIDQDWQAALAAPLDAAQIALGCGLGYLDMRHGARGWRDEAPTLARWYATFAERDAMVATRPE
ncbi:glutathione S-transferase family protein [Pseudooceanicola algae]|uniref:Putative GST-like protein YibF n=1 Tax=Pseudooceanicola algae TaxID=1537215 RepID=A0A418SAV7_9RHOB|nr:glutathione S-transferase family protein [Pseudooceanicola algae]QPM91251.1 putative GST-like protein YibF [Pseudooceanicola algae]